MQRLKYMAVFLLALVPVAGCSCPIHTIPSRRVRAESRHSINLYRHPLEIRLSAPLNVNPDFLVIYATGDGGWHGLDEQLYDWISEQGYPVAGFSAKGYLKNLGYVSGTTTPERLVQDFELIIKFAETELRLPPSTPVILAGLSRGAGLSVVAAGEGTLKPRLAGVLAIALTKEEEYVRHYRWLDRRHAGDVPKRELVEIKTYDYLSRLSGFPVMVIQSTGDNYITAADARKLFGPDTSLHKLKPVDARNHRFSGGCDQLYGEAVAGLTWIRETSRLTEAARDVEGSVSSMFMGLQ